MITECSDMGTGALKTVTRRLYDIVDAIPDTGSLSSDHLDPLQSLESLFVHGLAVVRHLVNATRPVNRLPPEILAEIFSLATEYGTLDRLHPLTWQLDLTQIRRMHALPTVCRYWHDVALGTRSLWPIIWSTTTTFKYRGRLMQEPPVFMHSPYPVAADYSGPLSLYFSESYPLKAKELLEKYAIRTRELYLIMGQLTGNTEDVSTLLDTLETVPGDALEHFAMKMVFLDVFPRKLSLFSAGGTKLRSLAIDRVNFCPTNTFPALTHLVVSYAAWTPGTFLDLLSRCPRLEHVQLGWLPALPVGPSVDTDRDPLPPGQRTVKLPHAVRFALTISASEDMLASAIETMLSGVALPPSCHVYLAPHVQGRSLTAQIGARSMRSALRHWPVPNTADADAANDVLRVRLDFDIDAELQIAHPHGGSGSLTLRSRQARASAIVQEMIRAASADPTAVSPPFTPGTKELWIRAQLRRGAADLECAATLLAGLPRLERLVVAGNPAAILQALAPCADREPAVLCCKLDTLSVFVYSRRDVEVVRAMLASRAQAGHAIRCVVIPGPLPDAKDPVTDGDAQTLRVLVEELVVVDTMGWGRVEVDWWTGRLREACRTNAALARSLHCDWPTWEYLGWK